MTAVKSCSTAFCYLADLCYCVLCSKFITYCSAYSSLMMEAVRTSETSVDNLSTRQYNPEDSSEHHTRRRENLKSHNIFLILIFRVRF
jgi:hypothetical protein